MTAQCKWTKADGEQCRARSLTDYQYCRAHKLKAEGRTDPNLLKGRQPRREVFKGEDARHWYEMYIRCRDRQTQPDQLSQEQILRALRELEAAYSTSDQEEVERLAERLRPYEDHPLVVARVEALMQ